MLFSVYYNTNPVSASDIVTISQAPNPTKTIQIIKTWVSGTLTVGGTLWFERTTSVVSGGGAATIASVDAYPPAIPSEAIVKAGPSVPSANVTGYVNLGATGPFFIEINLSDILLSPAPGGPTQTFMWRTTQITGNLALTIFWKEY